MRGSWLDGAGTCNHYPDTLPLREVWQLESLTSVLSPLPGVLAAHLVQVRRDELYAYYRLASSKVFTLWQAVRGVGEHQLAEIDRVVESYLGDRSALEAVSMAELYARLEQGEIELLDVRAETEHRAGHISEAHGVPLAELAQRFRELPTGREIVAYCCGPYCVFADEAAALLREQGYQAARPAEGFPEWQAAGLPISR